MSLNKITGMVQSHVNQDCSSIIRAFIECQKGVFYHLTLLKNTETKEIYATFIKHIDRRFQHLLFHVSSGLETDEGENYTGPIELSCDDILYMETVSVILDRK